LDLTFIKTLFLFLLVSPILLFFNTMDDDANEDALSTTVLEADEGAISDAGDYFADEDEPLRGPPDIFTTIHR
jgi:hypothetical protein